MNPKPIEQARDKDLRLSLPAMHRAAQRAHDDARRAGTLVVIVRDGVVEHVVPNAATTAETTVGSGVRRG